MRRVDLGARRERRIGEAVGGQRRRTGEQLCDGDVEAHGTVRRVVARIIVPRLPASRGRAGREPPAIA
jgi:hypothetical protein